MKGSDAGNLSEYHTCVHCYHIVHSHALHIYMCVMRVVRATVPQWRRSPRHHHRTDSNDKNGDGDGGSGDNELKTINDGD